MTSTNLAHHSPILPIVYSKTMAESYHIITYSVTVPSYFPSSPIFHPGACNSRLPIRFVGRRPILTSVPPSAYVSSGSLSGRILRTAFPEELPNNFTSCRDLPRPLHRKPPSRCGP